MLDVTLGLGHPADQRGDLARPARGPGRWPPCGGGPSALRQQGDRVREGDVDLGRAGGRGPAEHPGSEAGAGLELAVGGRHVDAVVGQDLVDVVPVRLGDMGPELGADVADVVDAGVAVDGLDRHHHVDAVRAPVDVLVDPGQLQLEFLGGERQGAQHAHAAGVGDGGDHVAAVGEGEDRVLDAEPLRERVVHADSSSITVRARR